MTSIKAEELDRIFDEGKEDVMQYFDMSTLRRASDALKRVNVDFPPRMVDELDREAARVGVARQAIIKMWIAERLDQQRAAAAA